MVRVGLAPCSPFSVSRDLMREAALLARDKGVMLHTHLAENDEDIAYSLANFGCRPGQYAEDLGWTGADVWHAHCVKLDGAEIDLFAALQRFVPEANAQFDAGDYTASLQTLAVLRGPVDAFFDDVMVNAEQLDLRLNRQGLLKSLHVAMNRVADLSRLAV